MRIFYFLTLLGSLAGRGLAQPVAPAAGPPAPSPSAFAPAPLTRADTARAVHELFRSRRGGGIGWLAVGTAGILGATLPAQQTTSAGVWTPGVVAGSAFVLIGLNKRIQFRRGRERRVLRELAATGHLPHSVLRRLRGNFAPLHGTASEENPLAAYGVPANASPAARPAAPEAPRLSAVGSPPVPNQASTDARTDTLDAVRGLFLSKRAGGTWPLVVFLPAARLLTGASSTTPNSSPYAPKADPPSGGSVALGLALMGAGLTYMLVHNAPYTKARYAELQQAYLSGQPLPAEIRQQLKPKHLEKGRQYRQRLERRALRRK